jgi:signal peptidase
MISVILGLTVAALAFVYFSPGYDIYVVRSGSMAPSIDIGDIIISGPVRNITPGTIITYSNGVELITHRVISVENNTLVTKGDAVEDPDSQPVDISRVTGMYLFKIPKIGYLINFIHTKLGWFLLIILPAAILVSFLVKDILKEAFKKDKKSTI